MKQKVVTTPPGDDSGTGAYTAMGGTINLTKCSACGGRHMGLEVEYTYPGVEMDGLVYTMTAKCPKNGSTIYFAITTRT